MWGPMLARRWKWRGMAWTLAWAHIGMNGRWLAGLSKSIHLRPEKREPQASPASQRQMRGAAFDGAKFCGDSAPLASMSIFSARAAKD